MARKKEDRALKLLAAESRLPAWLHRGTNTLFIVLAWPCILVGVVYLAAFLLSDQARYLNAVNIPLNGGFSHRKCREK